MRRTVVFFTTPQTHTGSVSLARRESGRSACDPRSASGKCVQQILDGAQTEAFELAHALAAGASRVRRVAVSKFTVRDA